jgi:hypothetical protein
LPCLTDIAAQETILETISRIRLADVGTAEKELPLAQLKERVKAMTNYPIIGAALPARPTALRRAARRA